MSSMSNKNKIKIHQKNHLNTKILYNFIDQSTEAQNELILTTKTLITCTKETKDAFNETKKEHQV